MSRTRNYTTVVYPESAPENWLEILTQHMVPAFVSPLHDADTNPTGELKKPHYHVVIMFEGVKTLEQAREITVSIGGVGCEAVKSMRGVARYLCHLDNPEKHQYNTEDVKSFAGADYITTIGLVTDKYVAIGEMIDWCIENGVVSYYELLVFSRTERPSWFRVLCDNGTVVIKEFLKSFAWTVERKTAVKPTDIKSDDFRPL